MAARDYSEEARRSLAHLDEIGPRLAAEAASEPDVGPRAGVILERGSPEYKTFRHLLQQASGREVVPEVLGGVVPLDQVVRIVAGGHPDLRDMLDLILRERVGHLPIVICTKNGMQLAAFVIPKAPGRPGDL